MKTAVLRSSTAAFRRSMLAIVICEARQVCKAPWDCISAIFCASAALSRFSCSTSVLVPSLSSNCEDTSELLAELFGERAVRYWPTAVRQSGETASEVSIMASCDVRALPSELPARYEEALPFIVTDEDFHAVLDAEGEFVERAMLMPAVSPNILATFTFSSA